MGSGELPKNEKQVIIALFVDRIGCSCDEIDDDIVYSRPKLR